MKKKLKDELTGNSNQLLSISTEVSARENGPKSLSEKNEVRYKKKMVVKQWNEVSEQVAELTSPKYLKIRRINIHLK